MGLFYLLGQFILQLSNLLRTMAFAFLAEPTKGRLFKYARARRDGGFRLADAVALEIGPKAFVNGKLKSGRTNWGKEIIPPPNSELPARYKCALKYTTVYISVHFLWFNGTQMLAAWLHFYLINGLWEIFCVRREDWHKNCSIAFR
jgi:hypothetical protein